MTTLLELAGVTWTARYKLEMFRTAGRPVIYEGDGFKESSWIAIYNGLCVEPDGYDTLVERKSETDGHSSKSRTIIRRGVESMPTMMSSSHATLERRMSELRQTCDGFAACDPQDRDRREAALRAGWRLRAGVIAAAASPRHRADRIR